jgi:hypothetical protein
MGLITEVDVVSLELNMGLITEVDVVSLELNMGWASAGCGHGNRLRHNFSLLPGWRRLISEGGQARSI